MFSLDESNACKNCFLSGLLTLRPYREACVNKTFLMRLMGLEAIYPKPDCYERT